jgi:hypothetical protein
VATFRCHGYLQMSWLPSDVVATFRRRGYPIGIRAALRQHYASQA